jgi:hypothetical protein
MENNEVRDSSLRVTVDRTFEPIGLFVNAINETWVLVRYYDSLGWIRRDLVNIDACSGELPMLAPDDPRLDLNAYYASNLPFAVGPDAPAPNPADWAPFAECINEYSYSRILERCAYQVYVDLYNSPSFQSPGNALTLGNMLAIVINGEFGADLVDPTTPFEALSQPQRYFVEAAARNLAGTCALNSYQPSLTEPTRCNVRGLMQFLLQVQSFYNTTNVNDLLGEVNEVESLLLFQRYAQLIDYAFQRAEWRMGAVGTVPFQWGNWLATNANGVYTTAAEIINNIPSRPVNVTVAGSWVYINLGTSPLLVDDRIFAIRNYPSDEDGGCSYTFAITIVLPRLGITESCGRG